MRSIRSQGYDYTRAGAYFITTCSADRNSRFGKVENGEMVLNEYGAIAYGRFPKSAGEGFTPFQSGEGNEKNINRDGLEGTTSRVAPTVTTTPIGGIIGAYISLVSIQCLEIYKNRNEVMGKLWQRNYWEIIIRNDRAIQNISDYIINNPKKWDQDKFYK